MKQDNKEPRWTKVKGRSSGQMLMTLKRAGEGHMSTSNDKLRLLMEACIHVPTTEMRVNGHFRHHTFLFPWWVGRGPGCARTDWNLLHARIRGTCSGTCSGIFLRQSLQSHQWDPQQKPHGQSSVLIFSTHKTGSDQRHKDRETSTSTKIRNFDKRQDFHELAQHCSRHKHVLFLSC